MEMRPPLSAPPRSRAVSARWSTAIVNRGWVPVANNFLDNYSALGISSREAMLVIHLISYKWGTDAPWPRYDVLAARMGVTSKQVQRLVRALEVKGFLRRERLAGKANRYDLRPLFAAIEAHVEAAEEKAARPARARRAAPLEEIAAQP